MREIMDTLPFFSICIPCFNHEKYIGATIQSVLGQAFQDFEIIVADNDSTDKSRDIVKSFNDLRIRLIANRFNIGFAPNLQQVTRNARGRYLNLLSSDDIMNQGALQTYAKLISQYAEDANRLVLMSQVWEIDENGKAFQYITKSPERFAPVRVKVPSLTEIEAQKHHEVHRGFDVFTNCMQLLDTAGMFCSVVYSRQLWEAVEGYNSTQLINPDMHFIIKVLRLNPTVIYVNRPLYKYRQHPMGQAQQQVKAQVLRFHVDQYKNLMQYDDDWLRGTAVTREYQRRLFINRDCFNHALLALVKGHWTYASRLLAFAWSTFPGVVIRQWKGWALLFLLVCGPFGIGLAWLLRFITTCNRKGLSSLADVSSSIKEIPPPYSRNNPGNAPEDSQYAIFHES
jgi:glycosyltransferase involved in cell wall biosynthesis